jgi:hypothetical protein
MNRARWQLACCVLLVASAAMAQNTQVSWWAMDMGAGTCRDANTMLTAVVGQRGIGSSVEGNTTLMGGFLANPLIGQSVVSVAEQAPIPQAYALLQNYPNPFNPSTTIRYELPKSCDLRLSVYDILGREVSVLVNETKNPGVYEVKFDATGLSSGVYFYRLIAGDFQKTRSLLLLK